MMPDPLIGSSGRQVQPIPSRYLTRHGLIAGSTGTGKSRAMQVLAEQLADSGSDVFVSDIKGDASGFCSPGMEHERNALAPYKPHGIETNYWSVSDRFIPIRFSLSVVGSILLSRLLCLNPTQESHLALAFAYARRMNAPLDDLSQLLDVLDAMVASRERGISPSSVSVIQRKIMSIQESGLSSLFGKPSLELSDLSRMNVLNLSDARKDMSVSIAPAFLLQSLFDSLPEIGDADAPRFVIFFDEAHYLFKDSNKSLRDLMVTMLKQIRSKGVSVFFVTQDVSDLPDELLSQLSTKIIFSQKVFTEKGNQRLRALARSFPNSGMDVMERLKALPPGTAIVSTLDDHGNQTPPKEVRIFAPATTMEMVPDETLREASDPKLIAKYSAKKAGKKGSDAPRPSITVHEPAKTGAKAGLAMSPPARAENRPRPDQAVSRSGQRGPSVWDGVFSFLLKLIDFLIKALSRVSTAIIIKPLRSFHKYLAKKPVRIIYLLGLVILLYFLVVNWGIISSLLAQLKLG